MTIEEFKNELRQLARDGKEKELEKKSQEIKRKFEAKEADLDRMETVAKNGGEVMTYTEASDILVTVDRDKLSKREDELFRLVRKAINKQVPIKPYIFMLATWTCPKCEKSYEDDDKYDFCPCCGQAIDWSNWEE